MEKRYRALRTIGTIYKILGALAGLMTVLTVIGLCVMSVVGGAAMQSFSNEAQLPAFMSGIAGGIIMGIVGIIYGGSISVTLYAFGEFIYLFLAIEENTRATLRVLEHGGNSSR